MSLKTIVKTVGGELTNMKGTAALIRAPGHSKNDRSVSLRLDDNNRVLVHCFNSDTRWQSVFDDLREQGLIDRDHRLTRHAGGGSAAPQSNPGDELSDMERIAVARRIFEPGVPIAGTLAARHLALRHVDGALPFLDDQVARFRFDTPVAAYRPEQPNGRRQPALLVAIRNPLGELTALEITYLTASGRRASNLHLNRKMIGVTPPNTAVRILPAASAMVVAEGFFTTLSAMKLFQRPGWALLSMRNLVTWEPPRDVRDVIIAGDRGRGETAAETLRARLQSGGVAARVMLPPAPYGDWSAYDDALVQQLKDGGSEESHQRILSMLVEAGRSAMPA